MFAKARKKNLNIEERKTAKKDVEESKAPEEDFLDSTTLSVPETPSPAPAVLKAKQTIPEDQQRELFKWILEEKRKVKPKDQQEKKRIDEEKAILKQFIRAKAIPIVETRLVIEKGVWDDIFPFEGGGHVHMKLQFVLNEEDRQRIRIMRESALRKKHDELLNSELRSPTHATTVGSNVAPSLMFNHDVSGKSGPKDVEGTHFTNDPSRIIYSEEASFLGSSGSVVAAKNQAPAELKADEANDPEKRSPLEKTPGKIRNMISAFENSLNQDMRPTPIKSQSSKTTHRTGDVQQASTHIRKREEQIGFVRALAGSTSSHETGQLEELRAGRIQAKGKKKDLKDKVKVMHKVDIQEANTSSEKLARASTGERASVSGRMLIEKGIHLLSNLFARRRHSGGNPLKQKNGKGIQAEVLQDANIQAGGTQIMDLMRSGHAEEKGQLGQMSYPIAENGREICVPGGTDIQGKAGDETSPSQRHKESIIEGSTDAETSRGPIGQTEM
ncbi:hypothetical protein GH714_001141 [Hevea brasiliensis]|uniref:Uncharacterized protein n=1 Tax=Hevea brasiliensis TaxID=3981 RepID=A0A6A6MYF6_HEVBR|nr:hypothetical protein GH714_001141 [Hevea brasiliensis]